MQAVLCFLSWNNNQNWLTFVGPLSVVLCFARCRCWCLTLAVRCMCGTARRWRWPRGRWPSSSPNTSGMGCLITRAVTSTLWTPEATIHSYPGGRCTHAHTQAHHQMGGCIRQPSRSIASSIFHWQEGSGSTWLGDIWQADGAQRDNIVQGEVHWLDGGKAATAKGRWRDWTRAKGVNPMCLEPSFQVFKVHFLHENCLCCHVRKHRGENAGLTTPPWCCPSSSRPFPPSWTG